MRLQANAEAAVVARCLTMLGATPDHISAVCNTFTQVFGESWDPQLSAQVEASAPRAAQSASPSGLAGASAPGVMEGQPQAGPSQAAAFSSGWESEQAGDLEAAERSYRQAVEEGHTSAAIQLAFLVYDRDKEEMWRLLHWAAEQGSAAAAWSLALEYNRMGPDHDLDMALEWYEVAAASKDREIRKHGKAEAKRLRNLLRERNADSFRSLETPALEDDEEPEPVDESIARRVRAEMSETEGRNRIELGEIEKGERLLREAADLGSFKAFSALVGRLADRGDRDELARMLEQELGEDRDVELPRVRVDDLRMTLANVFLSRADAGDRAEGDVEGGLRLLREVAEGGHDDLTREGACRRLHHWHDKWGHAEEAASWLRRIQARESADALEKRGGELIDKGQIQEGNACCARRRTAVPWGLSSRWRVG